MDIVVMGATGNVGSELVKLLAADGHAVRALSGHPQQNEALPENIRSFAVDLTRGETLRDTLAGVRGAFMLSGYDDSGIVAQLERAGVSRVALLSSGALSTTGVNNAVTAYHKASEQALQSSSLAWTFLRPNTFMTNALRWADAIRADHPIVAPFADVAIAVNDPRDIARVAVAALTTGDHAGQIHRITGPQALHPAEQVKILADVLGRELRFKPQSDAEARAEMEVSMPTAYVDAFFEFFSEGKTDETTVLSTVKTVTGREPRSFRHWATEHAPLFR